MEEIHNACELCWWLIPVIVGIIVTLVIFLCSCIRRDHDLTSNKKFYFAVENGWNDVAFPVLVGLLTIFVSILFSLFITTMVLNNAVAQEVQKVYNISANPNNKQYAYNKIPKESIAIPKNGEYMERYLVIEDNTVNIYKKDMNSSNFIKGE